MALHRRYVAGADELHRGPVSQRRDRRVFEPRHCPFERASHFGCIHQQAQQWQKRFPAFLSQLLSGKAASADADKFRKLRERNAELYC